MSKMYSCILSSKWVRLFLAGLLLCNSIGAQINIPTLPFAYNQGFNSYAGSAVTLPAGWTAAAASNFVEQGIGTGTNNTGAIYAFGTGGEYALGVLRSNNTGNITYAVSFVNNTGTAITSLSFSWDYEQWRYAGNTTGFDCSGTGGLAGNATLNSKDFSGAATGTNGTVSSTAVASFTLNGLNIANGASFGISWVTTDQVNADNGVAIDNFSMTATVPCTNPSITNQPSPLAQAVCQNLASTDLSITAGGTTPSFQWYSNTVNSNSGGSIITGANLDTYAPPSSITGTVYYYCIVSACSNTITSSTAAVTVSAPASATISYPGTPFCSNAGVQAVTRTGTTGGTYTALPAGLAIDPATGEIDPATSNAGTYTVTYTMAAAGGCAEQTATASVVITALPAATISYAAASFCNTAGTQAVTLTGTAGGTFTAAPAGLSINSSSGLITPSTSTEGTYTVTYSMTAPGNGCTVDQVTTATVSVKSTLTSISPVAIQDLSINNDGTTLTVSEGDVPVSRQWKYGTAPGGPYTNDLGTATTLVPNFSVAGTYYIVCVSTYPASPCGGSTVTSNEVQINVTNNVVVTAATSYGPFCNNTSNAVTVNFTYFPAANFPAGTTVFTAQLSDGTGSFASFTNIGTVVSDAGGSQTIAATIPAGVTGGTAFRIRVRSNNPNTIGTNNDNDFIIGGFPAAVISYAGSPYCSNAGVQPVTISGTTGGIFSSTAGLTIDPLTGAITTSSSTPGTYTVTYNMEAVGICPAQSTTTSVTITELPSATISYPASPFCSNGSLQTVTLSGTGGGTYTGEAGVTINSSTGTITPSSSTPGTYIITYTITAAGCPVQTSAASVTITEAPAAIISYAGSPFCSSDFTSKTVTRTGTSGGTYTASPAGLSINASTGDIAIFASVAGTYTVTYTMNAVTGCPPQTATTTVIITAAPAVADIAGSTTITLPGTTSLSNPTPGGVWTSTNTAVATVNASGVVTGVSAGTSIIRYTVSTGGCSNTASTAVNVLAAGGIGIWSNVITGTNPSSTNPYTAGQVVNSNLSVSGIGYTGVSSNVGNNRFNTTNWDASATVNTGKYIYFTLTPDAGYAIDFTSFVYTGQRSAADGPTILAIRSSVDGFGTGIGAPAVTGSSISLTGTDYQNITSPITFRIYATGASATTGTFSINDFTFYGNMRVLCTAPTSIEFVAQPGFVVQNAIMSPVLVRAKCGDGTTAAAYTGAVVLSVFNGCGYVTQTANAVAGIATFSNISFTRSAQADVKLQAFAAGFTPVLSDTFSVTAPVGLPATTTIAGENFEGSPTWAYSTGTAVTVGTGGTAGSDVIAIKTFSGNKSLVKSYSVDNAAGMRGSTNTITFANQAIAASFNHATFNFQLASLGTGSGAGNDNGEQLIIEISLDGGTQWNKLLTYTGNSDYLFPFTAATPETLAYNANAIYTKPALQSAFRVPLPSGTSQFRFRITATNNRTNENWSIDNISLVGTAAASAGVVNPLPVVTNKTLISCPNTNATITLVTANTVGVVSYVWTPATFISNTNISNPVVNPPGAAVYTATITDAEGCSATGTFTIALPGGSVGTWYGVNNSDWFQCGNWGGGVMPTNAINVTIPAAASNLADIDPLSAYATTYGGIARVNNITVDNKTLRLQVNAGLNAAGNLLIQNNGLIDMTGGGQIELAGSWTNTVGAAGFVAGAGTIQYAGTTAQTIAAENYFNLSSSSTGSRTMIGGASIGIAGSFSKGSNSYIFAPGNTVNYNGASAQFITPFAAGASTGSTYEHLTLSNTGTKSLTGATDVEGDLTLSNTVQLVLGNNFLTLKSTATKTARVAPVSAAANIVYGTGRFVIERYFPARRAWRLITAPVTVDAGKSLFNSWQVGGAALPGSGTYITGPGETTANGLDVSPQHNFSLKTFNQTNSQFDGVGNTKINLISGTAGVAGVPDNRGYFMFVRGDRTPANLNAFNAYGAVVETTLRDTGKIQVQSYSFPANPSVAANRYALIGNPYASPVDFTNVIKNGVANKFQAWDPKLNTVGGYVVVDLSAGVTIVPVGSTQTQVIQSKQAFIVETTNPAAPSVVFGENAKSADNNLTIFRPVTLPVASLAINLHTVNPDGSTILADGVMAQFSNDFSDGVDQFDALRFGNVNETFGILSNNSTYMLQRRKPLRESDTVFLSLKRTRQFQYRFNCMLNNMTGTGLSAWLHDDYLHTSSPINMQGDTWVDFAVTADAASAAAGRFYIVFKKSLQFTAVTATPEKSDVLVEWAVQHETAIDKYEVERSADDGISFAFVGSIDATGGTNYSWLDINPVPGIYYYRIKATGSYGEIKYSETVKITIIKSSPALFVFPNPVTNGSIQLQLNNRPAGTYHARLLNNLGQLLFTAKLQHPGGTGTQRLEAGISLASGLYNLEITEPDKKLSVIKVLVSSK
jgi:hypothetical protein